MLVVTVFVVLDCPGALTVLVVLLIEVPADVDHFLLAWLTTSVLPGTIELVSVACTQREDFPQDGTKKTLQHR